MQVRVIHVELGLERLALLAIARLDGFLELEGRVGRRQHRRRMGADHVQLRLGQACNVEAVVDDGVVQRLVLAIAVAHINCRQHDFVGPGR